MCGQRKDQAGINMRTSNTKIPIIIPYRGDFFETHNLRFQKVKYVNAKPCQWTNIEQRKKK